MLRVLCVLRRRLGVDCDRCRSVAEYCVEGHSHFQASRAPNAQQVRHLNLPWPESWPATWYENDDVYLDYTGDGYYLYDRNHPGVGIAVTVSF
jgi:hypothetical protein